MKQLLLLLALSFFLFLTPDALAQVPPNDLCVNAIFLSCGDSYADSTDFATSNDVEPVCGPCCLEQGAGVWFSFTGSGDNMTVSTDNPGTNFDTELILYSGSCDSLTCITGDDDGGSGLTSDITFSTQADTTYYVYVDGHSTDVGNYELTLTCVAPSNDSCNAPISMGMNANGFCPLAGILGNNLAATADTDVGCAGSTTNGVWYSFTTGPTQTIASVTINIISGSHAVLVIDSCGGSDIYCTLPGDFVLRNLTPSTTYLISVFSYLGPGGSFELCVQEPGPPPVNDLCINAIALDCGGSYADSTDWASDDDVRPVCQGPPGNCCIEEGFGVWFSFTGTGDAMTLSTDNPGTDFDTELALYRGSCDTLTCIGGDDDGGSNATSVITFSTQADTIYYVYVDGDVISVGNYELSLTCVAPSNDSCSNAIALPMNTLGNCPDSAELGNNLAATADVSSGCGYSTNDGVWYSFMTGPSQTVASVTMNIISGSHAVMVLDSCGATTFLHCDFPGDFILRNLTPMTTYLIHVFSFSGPGGSFEVCVQEPDLPPVNDLCINAIALGCGGSYADSTMWATTLDVEPVCQGPPGNCCIESGSGVWFSFTGTGDTMTLSTDNPGTDFDTELALYRGSCDTLTCIGGDDDGGSSGKSVIAFLSEADTTYYVYVDGNVNSTGNYELSLTCQAPANDSCNAAIFLPMNTYGNCPDSAVLGNDLAATADTDVGCTGSTTNGVWYSFTTGPSQTRALVTMNIISGSHAVFVLDSCGGSLIYCAFPGDFILNNLTPSATYLISVFSFMGPGGSFELCVQEPPPPPVNDLCSNSLPLTMGVQGSCTGNAVSGSTIPATSDTTSCAGVFPGVWYHFTTGPTQTGVHITGTNFSGFHYFELYDSCGGNSITCRFSILDQLVASLSPSTTYQLLVVGFAVGDFEVCVQEPGPPPSNDLCINAIQLECGSSHTDSTDWATNDDVQPVCMGPPGSGNVEEGIGVWFSFTGTGDAMTLSTDNPGTDFDTELALYRGSCDTLTCIGGDDDGGSGLTSAITFSTQADTTYYIYVDGNTTSVGHYELSLTCQAPANDSCNAAIILPMNAFGHCPDSAVLGNNLAATVDPGGACISGTSVWYSFTTGPAQTVAGVTLNILSGVNHAVAVSDSCGSLVSLYCALAGDFSIADLMPSTTYLISVISFSSQGGSFEICVHEPGLPPTNDLCVDATALVCGDHYFGSTFWATSDDVEPVCQGPPGGGGVEEGRGVWYSFVGDGDSITLSTDNPGTNFDTELALYRGSCDTLTCIGGDDDGGSGFTSKIWFLSERDSTYYVYIDGHAINTGNFELSISCDCPLFLILTGSSMNGDDYETSGNLSSDQLIVAGDTVDYDAAVDIDLLLGFEVQLGAVFNAFIDGCNNGGGGDNLTGDDSLDALSKPVQPEWIEAYLEKLTLVKKQNPGLYSEIEKLILQDGFTIQKLKEKGYDDLLKTFNLNDNKLFKR